MKTLMVCLGNICRSPLAEGVLRSKVKEAGLDWEIDSAGTSFYQAGFPPHELSQQIATLHDIDISGHGCRQFTKDDINHYDKIYVMDKQNYINVKKISGKNWDERKVDLLMNEVHPAKNISIPDPYFGKEEDYAKVYRMIDEACDAIVKKYALLHSVKYHDK
jgi:protein-tyrosine phosphatase